MPQSHALGTVGLDGDALLNDSSTYNIRKSYIRISIFYSDFAAKMTFMKLYKAVYNVNGY